MGGVFLLLLIAAFCFPEINGANRWIKIRLPGLVMTLQPSEFAKIAVALFVAKYCSENIRTFNNFLGRRGVLPLVGIAGAVICGILIGRDFGTTALVLTVAVAISVMAGLRWYYLAIPGTLVVLAGLYVVFFDANRLGRVTTFLRPEEMREGGGYQLWNSLLAFGSGGWTRRRLHGEPPEAEVPARAAHGLHSFDRRRRARPHRACSASWRSTPFSPGTGSGSA